MGLAWLNWRILRRQHQLEVERQAVRIIEVDHHRFGLHLGEEDFFGLPVGLHVTVVIEVILREVGEHRHFDLGARETPLFQTNGRRLQGQVCEARVHGLAHRLLQLRGLHGGELALALVRGA